jgi:cytochrome c5
MKIRFILIAFLIAALAACTDDEQYAKQPTPLRVDSIGISEVQVCLPNIDGRELIDRYCVPCHSLRYIEMQPALDRHAWEKTVTKMIKMYGAPVPDSVTAAAIVNYLVKIKEKDSDD